MSPKINAIRQTTETEVYNLIKHQSQSCIFTILQPIHFSRESVFNTMLVLKNYETCPNGQNIYVSKALLPYYRHEQLWIFVLWDDTSVVIDFNLRSRDTQSPWSIFSLVDYLCRCLMNQSQCDMDQDYRKCGPDYKNICYSSSTNRPDNRPYSVH